jgi:hypothetical protein
MTGALCVTRIVHLHIGAGKTGTSALQAALVRNRAWLATYGVDYPPSPSDEAAAGYRITSGNGLLLAFALNPKLAMPPSITQADPIQDTLEVVVNSKQEHVLFSSELMLVFSGPRAARLRDEFAPHGIGLRFHFWVRNIAGHACSAYSQQVKRHRYTGDFSAFVRNHYNPDFYGVLQRTTGVVGKENVIVTSYDRHREHLFGTLCRSLGVEAGGFEEVRRTINRSLSREELEVMRSLNATLRSDMEGVAMSDKMIYRAPEDKAVHIITSVERDLLADRFGREIDKVNAFCGEAMISLLSDDVVVADNAPCPKQIKPRKGGGSGRGG